MAYEIEEYLLEKFTSEIDSDEIGSNDALHKQFDELGKLLKTNLAAYASQTPPSGGDHERLESIRDRLYCVNNIVSEYKSKSKSKFFRARYWNTRSRLNKIRKEQLQQLGENKTNDVIEPLPHGSSSSPDDSNNNNNAIVEHTHRSTPWIDTTGEINGFDRELESLRKSLIEEKHTNDEEHSSSRSRTFKAIGIVGRGGIGKTYLCQWLFNDEKVMNHFAPRIWVCMPREPNENEDKRVAIVKRMLVCLGVEEEMLGFDELEGLLSLLHQQLWGKRYLIVLDDARDYEDTWYHNLCCFLTHGSNWKDKLGYGLPKCSGGTVIVTARNEDTAMKMVGGENLRKLRIQDEASCWRIFRDSAEEGNVEKLELSGDDDDMEMKEIRNEIMQKCEGLPLAAKLMGQIVNQHTRETR